MKTKMMIFGIVLFSLMIIQSASAGFVDYTDECDDGDVLYYCQDAYTAAAKSCENGHWDHQGADLYPCEYGCENGHCISCIRTTSNAYKECYNGDVWWYDNCGDRTYRYDDCGYGETCSNGQCVPTVVDTCESKSCYNNDVWCYNNLGQRDHLYDDCTSQEKCYNGQCVPINQPCSNPYGEHGDSRCDYNIKQYLICDNGDWDCQGSYAYCSHCNHCGDGSCNCYETYETCPTDCKPECTEGWINDYRCDENTRQQKYQYEDCSYDWIDKEVCDYQCVDGQCIPNCDDQDGEYGDAYCFEDDVYIEYRDYYWNEQECVYNSTQIQKYDCPYQCCNGECVGECDDDSDCDDSYYSNNYCIDDDVYRDYIYFTCMVTGVECNAKYCVKNNETQLVEECEYGCSDGQCLDECTCDQDCGTEYYSDRYCFEDDVYKTRYYFKCIDGQCNNFNEKILVEDCVEGCEDGYCISSGNCTLDIYTFDNWCNNYLVTDIFVDNELKGHTNHLMVNVTPGEHTVEATRDNYSPDSKIIYCEGGETIEILLYLDRINGPVVPPWNPPSWSGGSFNFTTPSWSSPSWNTPTWTTPTWSTPEWSTPSWSSPSWNTPTWTTPTWSSPSWSVPEWSSPTWTTPSFEVPEWNPPSFNWEDKGWNW